MRLFKFCCLIVIVLVFLWGILIWEFLMFLCFLVSLFDLFRERLGDFVCSIVSSGDNDFLCFDWFGVDGVLILLFWLLFICDCGCDGVFCGDDEVFFAFVVDVDFAELFFFWFAIKRLRVELNWFFIWLFVCFGIDCDIIVYLFLWIVCCVRIVEFFFVVNGFRFTFGFSWLYYRSRYDLFDCFVNVLVIVV